MPHRVARRAADDLDEIWLYVAEESQSIEVASKLIESITDRFFLLGNHPYVGRARDRDFGAGSRTFPVGEYVILYSLEGQNVLILRVVHGRRDLAALFGESIS